MAAAIARVLSRISGTEVEVETLKTIAIFCGVAGSCLGSLLRFERRLFLRLELRQSFERKLTPL